MRVVSKAIFMIDFPLRSSLPRLTISYYKMMRLDSSHGLFISINKKNNLSLYSRVYC
nr:MAG TPA: hypothetical protein [Myoviridae sp. ctfuG5]